MKGIAPRRLFARRLLEKTLFGDGCWEWQGTDNRHGYGQLRLGSRYPMAHRSMYELFRGPIPDGLVIDHLCRNTRCVRPSHLEPVTSAVNSQRGRNSALREWPTHCQRGHEFTTENTIPDPKWPQSRVCRRCKYDRNRESEARMRERRVAS